MTIFYIVAEQPRWGNFNKCMFSEADPDLELKEKGGGAVLSCLPSRLSSFCDFFFFLRKIMGGGRPPGPLP